KKVDRCTSTSSTTASSKVASSSPVKTRPSASPSPSTATRAFAKSPPAPSTSSCGTPPQRLPDNHELCDSRQFLKRKFVQPRNGPLRPVFLINWPPHPTRGHGIELADEEPERGERLVGCRARYRSIFAPHSSHSK